MEGPGCRTDGQNAATRSSAQPPSWAPDGRMQADGVSNQISPKTHKHTFDNLTVLLRVTQMPQFAVSFSDAAVISVR